MNNIPAIATQMGQNLTKKIAELPKVAFPKSPVRTASAPPVDFDQILRDASVTPTVPEQAPQTPETPLSTGHDISSLGTETPQTTVPPIVEDAKLINVAAPIRKKIVIPDALQSQNDKRDPSSVTAESPVVVDSQPPVSESGTDTSILTTPERFYVMPDGRRLDPQSPESQRN